MVLEYLQLIGLGLIPAALAIVFYLLIKFTSFKNLKWIYKQIIFGIAFGICAILSTEFGPYINGIQTNVRDAAVLIAGLFFGWPAGLIAGVIGAAERGLCILWGGGTYTAIACCTATLLSGVYAGLIRKFLLDDKRPSWFMAAAMAIVMECIHMSLILLTHINDFEVAMQKVRSLTLILMVANAVSVLVAGVVISILDKDKITMRHSKLTITNIIQRYLLIVVIGSFLVTSGLNYAITKSISVNTVTASMKTEQSDIKADLKLASDENMLFLSEVVYLGSFSGKSLDEITNDYLRYVATEIYDIAEINVVDRRGIIIRSTNPAWINFDMHSGSQSSEFLCLLDGKTQYFVQPYMPTSGNPDVLMKYAGIATDFGFIQIGYNSAQFKDDLIHKIKTQGLIDNRHVGQTGYTMFLDEDQKLIAYPKEFATTPSIELISYNSFDELESIGNCTLRVNGEDCIGLYEYSEGLIILSYQTEEEAYSSMYISIYFTTFMQIYIYAILFVVIYFLINGLVISKLKKINESLKLITNGNLKVKVSIKGNMEVISLADGINMTVDSLKKYIEKAKEKIAEELEMAKEIQASSLPQVNGWFENNKNFDIYASMCPAKEVGGDFYDFYLTQDEIVHILIADVSGKGIPAAMFMMKSKANLKGDTQVLGDLGEAFTNTNNTLCAGNDQGMFVTAWQGGVDINNGEVNFVNAGHNPPLIKRKGGKFEFLKSKCGFVLAGLEGFKYEQQSLKLEPGDIIFLYTDGVTEATNVNNELFGEERLLEVVNSYEPSSMKDLCIHVREEVDKFVGEADQFDDITMLAFKYKGGDPIHTLTIEEAEIKDITTITDFVEKQMESHEPSMKAVMQINVAIDEIVSNIINHGYNGRKGKITISLKMKDDINAIALRFIDEGVPYNPLNANKPDITLSAEERAIGGLGIYMVKETMDEIKYRYEKGKNILTLYKVYK